MRKGKKVKVIIIVGPNASGKSNLAIRIASKIGGEIISADSRQVYRGMDIGSGKITQKEMRGIPHHLLDVASPRYEFNVSHFKKLAAKKIEEITNRGCMPIVVGGTGFWIDALIYGLDLPEIGPDKKMRAELELKSIKKLFTRLKKLDPKRAENIDNKNKRRLIRSLEIVLTSKKPVPVLTKELKYNPLIIGIKKPKEELERSIYNRLITRLTEGMIGEVKKLHESGVSWKRLDNFGLEYRYISRYLRGRLDYNEMVTELFIAIKHYAKRQMTWFTRPHFLDKRGTGFKRNGAISWFNANKKRVNEEVLDMVSKFLHS